MSKYTVVVYHDDDPEELAPLDWFSVGVPMSDKSVPDEAREYLKARAWTAKSMERARLRYVPGALIAERWRASTVRDSYTEKKKDGARPERYQPTGGIVLPFAADYGVIRVFYKVEHGEPHAKFVMPGRQAARIFIPHHMRGSKALAGGRSDTPAHKRAPLVIVESPLKAEAAAAHGIPSIGISGCFGWRVPKSAATEAALNCDDAFALAIRPEILELCPQGRAVILLVDGDYRTNHQVAAALLSFIDLALACGRVPLVRPLPDAMGIDDWLAAGHTRADFDALLTHGPDSAIVRRLRVPFYPLNETGLADRFVGLHGDMTFHDSQAGQWYSQNADGWREGVMIPQERMLEVARAVALEANAEKNAAKKVARFRFADMCAKASTQNAALSQAIRTGRIKIDSALFDADPNLIGVKNGILNLRDGKLLAPRRELMVTRSAGCAFDPKATAPRFVDFIEKAVNGDKDLKRHIQEIVGAALLGRAIRTTIHVFYGPGGCGKTTLIEIVLALLGEYAMASKADLLLRQHRSTDPERASPFLKTLRGRRLVVCSELNEGVAFDDALIKDLTGGDTITARGLHEAPVTFRNTATIWVRGNHLPVIGADSAMRERVNVAPMNHVIAVGERDKTMAESIIATELAGVLNWALLGMRRYVERGFEFALPNAVNVATAKMQRESDVIGLWLEACVEVDATKTELPFREDARDVVRSYRDWAAQNGHQPKSAKSLFADLRRRFGLEDWPLKSNGRHLAIGFKLNRDPVASDLAEQYLADMQAKKAINDHLALELAEARRKIAALEATAASASSASFLAPVVPINRARQG